MGSDLPAYLNAVWGRSRPDAYLEISARVNGPVGSARSKAKKASWTTQHVRLGDLLDGGQDVVQPLIDMSRMPTRMDLYIGCMPLSEPPEKGRGKGSLRESVPGIWFDIDAQAPGREASAQGLPLFATPEKALEALDIFCAGRGVSAGVVTNSGWGLHAWILLDHDWNECPPEMTELVRKWNLDFAAWCKEMYGIHVDVVSDKTRVLRIPDTTNWRKADNLDEADTVRVLRLEPSNAYSAQALGWSEEFVAEVQAAAVAARERLARGIGSGSGLEGNGALFSGVAALDACSWSEILEPFGWRRMDTEGSGEVERWGRPRGVGGGSIGLDDPETSSAVVFADAPWVLVVFSEAAELPSWQEVRRGDKKPNTKWRTWVRLKYGTDEMYEVEAASHAVTIALHGHPRHWPASAVAVLSADGAIYRDFIAASGLPGASMRKAGVGAA